MPLPGGVVTAQTLSSVTDLHAPPGPSRCRWGPRGRTSATAMTAPIQGPHATSRFLLERPPGRPAAGPAPHIPVLQHLPLLPREPGSVCTGGGGGTRMLAAGHTAPFPLGVGLWQQEESAEGPGSGRRCWQGLGEAGHGVGPATGAQKEGLRVGAEARWEGPGSLRPWSCCPLDLRAGTSGRRGCRLRAHHTRMGSSVTCSCRHLTGSLPLSFQSPTGLAVLPRPSPRPLS